MSKYIETLEIVEAEQFVEGKKPFKAGDKFAGLVIAGSGPNVNIAVNGKNTGLGGWVVTHANGDKEILYDGEFKQRYAEA